MAHTAPDGRAHPLEEHLRAVAALAGRFAAKWDAESWGALAGLWHDLGKYSAAFQAYIRGDDAAEAHIEASPGRVDHSSAGALHAVERFGQAGRILAYVIAGHHAGLADWATEGAGPTPLSLRLDKRHHLDAALRGSLSGQPAAELLQAAAPLAGARPGSDAALWIRMLFSALVDADFLDTESFMEPQRGRLRGAYPAIDRLLPQLDSHLATLGRGAPDTPVNRLRREVLEACRRKAEEPPGVFSLTVPTGGGKTLSSLAFALRHAARHGLDRVIYVIPYTSIIEQTAEVFRDLFEPLGDVVVEHHSALDGKWETAQSRVAAENWDAPLVVTTSVQFFESLFANRPSRCRKLHNVARSVVILDEAQLLPIEFLDPVLHALDQLVGTYGSTVLLSTATMPALDPREGFRGLAGRREIVADPDDLALRLHRVRVRLPDDMGRPTTWEDLAGRIAKHPQILCIVDRRADCRTLFGLLGADAAHLSALMCPAHRSAVIAQVKARLAAGAPVRVVSTQLVEAGVDIDFPVVYRALAALPSIAQAAGRCNREGRLSGLGECIVFVPPSDPPPGILRQGRDVTRALLADESDTSLLAPAQFKRFFRDLYWLQGDRLDRHGILRDLLAPTRDLRFDFATASRLFRIIPEDEIPVVVPWGESPGIVSDIERHGPDRFRLRRLQRFTVNIPRRQHAALLAAGAVREIAAAPGLFVLAHPELYDPAVGLIPDATRPVDPGTLIV